MEEKVNPQSGVGWVTCRRIPANHSASTVYGVQADTSYSCINEQIMLASV